MQFEVFRTSIATWDVYEGNILHQVIYDGDWKCSCRYSKFKRICNGITEVWKRFFRAKE